MKSNVSDHLKLMECILLDASIGCPADVSVVRDLMTIRSRVKDEGLSFLTITLPQFCRDLEQALQKGEIDSTSFSGFRRVKDGLIPAFLQGITSHIFDRETGRIYDEHSPIFVEAARQICLAFKKMEVACTPAREHAALDNFVTVEQSLAELEFPDSSEAVRDFLEVSDLLWHNCLAGFQLDMLVPRHGPGATAERISGNQKYVWREWYDRLEVLFPFLGNAYSVSLSEADSEFQKVSIVQTDQEKPVRVVLVPKTLKSPRVIAIEPVCMQYAQQAARDFLYEKIESYWLTRGHVNFTDQTINQRLALTSSKDGRLATIDLSDASDRVPRELALKMLRSSPILCDFVDACRSRSAELPDGRIIAPLRKFASMGSALCFPIEAMYFYTICVVARLKKHHLPVTSRNIFMMTRDVYVYGDDILVPSDDAGAVLDHLHKYHCKVNVSKTFVTGKFRESCGVDAYDGVMVTPIYLRKVRPENRQHESELVSWVATANLFYKKGYWRVASHMFDVCEKILGPLPYVPPNSSALGRESFLGYVSAHRWNVFTQSLEMRAWVPSPVYRSDSVDGYSALQKCLLRLEGVVPTPHERGDGLRDHIQYVLDVAAVDTRHLERTALRGAVTLKRRWVPTHVG